MNGYCKILRGYFGAQFNLSDGTWSAIKVYHDGNPIVFAVGFATEEEAEAAAGEEHARLLADNGQFGVGA